MRGKHQKEDEIRGRRVKERSGSRSRRKYRKIKSRRKTLEEQAIERKRKKFRRRRDDT